MNGPLGHEAAAIHAEQKVGNDSMTIHVIRNETLDPAGKLADAELHFTKGPLRGLKLNDPRLQARVV